MAQAENECAERVAATQPSVRASLGSTRDEILDGFKRADRQNVGRQITEAAIIGDSLRFRWQGSGKLGVVVGDIGIRDASETEYEELEEAVELGQVQIYTTDLYVFSRRFKVNQVLHQATGNPLQENSPAAIRQRERWARAEQQQDAHH